MPRFITHDAIADGYFNRNFTGGTGQHAPWKSQLTNNESILPLMLIRMQKDYCALAPRMRKPWNSSAVVSSLHICFNSKKFASTFWYLQKLDLII